MTGLGQSVQIPVILPLPGLYFRTDLGEVSATGLIGRFLLQTFGRFRPDLRVGLSSPGSVQHRSWCGSRSSSQSRWAMPSA
jgi:hypothetical protein